MKPSILEKKILIQDLWRKNIDQDESIPEDLVKRWKRWLYNLLKIENIGIPPWIGFIDGENCKIEQTELIIFSDASKPAYSDVTYVKVNKYKTKRLKCTFFLLNSHLAPLKKNP